MSSPTDTIDATALKYVCGRTVAILLGICIGLILSFVSQTRDFRKREPLLVAALADARQRNEIAYFKLKAAIDAGKFKVLVPINE